VYHFRYFDSFVSIERNKIMDLLTILTHVRCITKPLTEVRDMAVSSEGVSMTLDTKAGQCDREIVTLSFVPDPAYAGQPNSPIYCSARSPQAGFIGEWVVQGNMYDHSAAWLALMANRSGAQAYWFDDQIKMA
jgi:hypothetical protein